MHPSIIGFRLFVALWVVGLAPASSCWADKAKPNSRETREDMLRLHNRHRLAHDKEPLKLNPKLSAAAQSYAEFLARSGKFSHTAKGSVSSRVKRAGYEPKAVGENLAVGQKSTSAVVTGWIRSKGHKKNVLNRRFTEVGFGIARDKKGRFVWVTDFGDR